MKSVALAALVTLASAELQCRLDPKVNADTFAAYVDNHEIGFLCESACGRNRGIFVVEPADGHTYNCAKFPEAWNVTDANGMQKFDDAQHAVEVVDKFIQSVFGSSPEYKRKTDPGSCDFEALSAYVCGREEPWKTAPWADK